MTEPATRVIEPEAAPVTDPPDTPEGASGPQDVPDADPRIDALSAESKRYRLRAKDAEGARDGLQARLDVHDKGAAERIAAEVLTDASDLWLLSDIADLRGKDGALSEDAVRAAVGNAISARPHWSKLGRADNGQGVRRPTKQPEGFGAKLKSVV